MQLKSKSIKIPYLTNMALEALLKAAAAKTVTIHTEVDGRPHVRVTFGTRQLLDEALVVIRLEQRV